VSSSSFTVVDRDERREDAGGTALGGKACATVEDPLAELGGQLIEVRRDAPAERCCSLVGRHGVEIVGSQQPTVVAHLPKRTAVLTEVVLMRSAAAGVELVRLESELSRELRDRAK
jgi:hypothetical protein